MTADIAKSRLARTKSDPADGLRAAKLFGSQLPAFRGNAEAERALYGERDELVRKLTELSRRSAVFRPDFSPESLKDLEHWYFELLEGGGFHSIDTDEETFERAIAMYLGQVLVRNAPRRCRAQSSAC